MTPGERVVFIVIIASLTPVLIVGMITIVARFTEKFLEKRIEKKRRQSERVHSQRGYAGVTGVMGYTGVMGITGLTGTRISGENGQQGLTSMTEPARDGFNELVHLIRDDSGTSERTEFTYGPASSVPRTPVSKTHLCSSAGLSRYEILVGQKGLSGQETP